MKNKKLFAILTLVCFMLTLMPVAAFAADVDDQTSYVLTVKDNPTIKIDGNAEITFDFDGASATTVYVWFLKDGASVPSNKVAVDADGDNAGAISIAENAANANIFKINAVQAEEYSFIFSDAGEYKVKASLDIAADKTVGSSVVSSSNIGHPLQNIATQGTITVKENNAATSKYKMVDVNSALTEATATADGYIIDGEAVTLNGLTANNASTKTVKLQLLDENNDAVKGATMSIEAGSANVTVSKTTATTNALGQFSFDVTAAREGEYKIYVGTGSYEATIIVNAGTTAASTIVLETAPQAPTALDDDYTSNNKGLSGKIGFRIYDAAGSEVKSASNVGITNATNSITTSSDDAKNFVALTSKPAASDLDSENFEIAWKGDEYGWTIVMDETFDEEGTYEFKVVLDNGAYATASIEVKEMGTPVGIVITYYTDAVELGASITPRAINWIDANNVTKAINSSVDIAVSGYAVANVERVNALPVITVKDDEKYVGSEITVTAVDERYNLVATKTLTVANEAKELAFNTKTCEVNVNNKIVAQIVDADGNKVTPSGIVDGTASVVVLDKPEGAKVSTSVSSVNAQKGTFDINLTSNTVGNVTLQAVLKVTKYDNENNTNIVKYYSGTQIFAVGNGSVGDVVVMSIGSNEIIVNDAKATIDAAPIVQNDRTYVPFRALAEAFGAEVAYDEATQAVTAELNGVTVVMTIGSATYTVNGAEQTMDVAPFINGSRTMVPVRFVAEAFGIKVIPTYDENGATADILFNL